jgi:hypothetical protein
MLLLRDGLGMLGDVLVYSVMMARQQRCSRTGEGRQWPPKPRNSSRGIPRLHPVYKPFCFNTDRSLYVDKLLLRSKCLLSRGRCKLLQQVQTWFSTLMSADTVAKTKLRQQGHNNRLSHHVRRCVRVKLLHAIQNGLLRLRAQTLRPSLSSVIRCEPGFLNHEPGWCVRVQASSSGPNCRQSRARTLRSSLSVRI